jgi:hypothetical protein
VQRAEQRAVSEPSSERAARRQRAVQRAVSELCSELCSELSSPLQARGAPLCAGRPPCDPSRSPLHGSYPTFESGLDTFSSRITRMDFVLLRGMHVVPSRMRVVSSSRVCSCRACRSARAGVGACCRYKFVSWRKSRVLTLYSLASPLYQHRARVTQYRMVGLGLDTSEERVLDLSRQTCTARVFLNQKASLTLTTVEHRA